MAILDFVTATVAELQDAFAAGGLSALAMVRAYLARIEAYDRGLPGLDAVREVNPDALAIAARLDTRRRSGAQSRPLDGIPILLKDNIATGDAQHTTAGSLALCRGPRGPRRDARQTIARWPAPIILGKANLTEFANMLAIDMPAGYSSLGGQVRNPYAPAVDGQWHSDRFPGRVERGLGGGGGGGALRGGDRHRDFGLAAVAGEPERSRRGEADNRAREPRRHPADRAQPGYGGSLDANRARRRDPA